MGAATRHGRFDGVGPRFAVAVDVVSICSMKLEFWLERLRLERCGCGTVTFDSFSAQTHVLRGWFTARSIVLLDILSVVFP